MSTSSQPGGDRRGERSGPCGILDRLPDDRIIECESGWYPLLKDLDRELGEVDRGYRLLQVKQKMAQLMIVWEPGALLEAPARERAHLAVRRAEARSRVVCEICAARGTFSELGDSYQVLCKSCRRERGYEPALRPLTAAFAAIHPSVDPRTFNVWTSGRPGKFSVTSEALLSHWAVDAADQPSHRQMTEARGYLSVVDGRIDRDGRHDISWALAGVDAQRWLAWARMRQRSDGDARS